MKLQAFILADKAPAFSLVFEIGFRFALVRPGEKKMGPFWFNYFRDAAGSWLRHRRAPFALALANATFATDGGPPSLSDLRCAVCVRCVCGQLRWFQGRVLGVAVCVCGGCCGCGCFPLVYSSTKDQRPKAPAQAQAGFSRARLEIGNMRASTRGPRGPHCLCQVKSRFALFGGKKAICRGGGPRAQELVRAGVVLTIPRSLERVRREVFVVGSAAVPGAQSLGLAPKSNRAPGIGL